MTSTPRVAIAGAGIGGLATAIALMEKGFPVDLYEQAPVLGEVGSGMHLAPNGSRVLQRWGLAERLGAHAVRPVGLEIRHWQTGGVLANQPMGDQWEQEFGAAYYTVLRSDLHRVLADRVPASRLHLRRRLTRYSEEPGGGVRLWFEDGSAAVADVLVGADGMHSVVRRSVSGPDSPVFSGTIEHGLRRYERVRQSRTAKIQLGSRGGGSLRLSSSPATSQGSLQSVVSDVSWLYHYDPELEAAADPALAAEAEAGAQA